MDYATAEAVTTYGILGIKVWIYHGEVLPGQTILDTRKPFESNDRPRGPRGDRGDRGDFKKGPRQPRPQGQSKQVKED